MNPFVKHSPQIVRYRGGRFLFVDTFIYTTEILIRLNKRNNKNFIEGISAIATIASLDIALGANSANLKKDLDKAGKSTKDFSSKAKKQADMVGKAFKAIGLAIGAIAAAAGVNVLLAHADALVKNADGAGIAFDSFQKLEFGLQQAGLSSGSLNGAMLKVNKAMAAAGKGSASAVNEFAQIGLT
ncbi:MAG: hypothetical protein ACK4KU_14505, partial [Acinetobacter sp.]|uniref:hypothetical protein n=1 Tax=Acinetobacter sp. TaxID=472 RepID=UPI00391BD335